MILCLLGPCLSTGWHVVFSATAELYVFQRSGVWPRPKLSATTGRSWPRCGYATNAPDHSADAAAHKKRPREPVGRPTTRP